MLLSAVRVKQEFESEQLKGTGDAFHRDQAAGIEDPPEMSGSETEFPFTNKDFTSGNEKRE